MIFDDIWWYLVIFDDDIWWHIMIHIMIYHDIWWYIMIFDDRWWHSHFCPFWGIYLLTTLHVFQQISHVKRVPMPIMCHIWQFGSQLRSWFYQNGLKWSTWQICICCHFWQFVSEISAYYSQNANIGRYGKSSGRRRRMLFWSRIVGDPRYARDKVIFVTKKKMKNFFFYPNVDIH